MDVLQAIHEEGIGGRKQLKLFISLRSLCSASASYILQHAVPSYIMFLNEFPEIDGFLITQLNRKKPIPMAERSKARSAADHLLGLRV
jgi:hypothetical protein